MWQHPTIASTDTSGSFAPIWQFEELEIHKVFLRSPNFILEQNLSPLSLPELCGAALAAPCNRLVEPEKPNHLPPAAAVAAAGIFIPHLGGTPPEV